jgi:hypothetical protein
VYAKEAGKKPNKREKPMGRKKPWMTQLNPNKKRQQVKADKQSQQEQQDQQQHSHYGKESSE